MEFSEFKAQLKPHTPILGFDYGEKRLGVAVSDRLWLAATAGKNPLRTSLKQFVASIEQLVS